MHICFFDKKKEWQQALKQEMTSEHKQAPLSIFEDYHYVTNTLTTKNVADKGLPIPAYFVSPANSYGSMDGGIDAVYLSMDFDIEKKVRAAISQLPYLDSQGRRYNPVGHAVIVPFMYGHHLVSSPTMRVPGVDVSRTNNAYLAMLATLQALQRVGVLTVASSRDTASDKSVGTLWVCGLGTAIGQMPFPVAAQQTLSAITDFAAQ